MIKIRTWYNTTQDKYFTDYTQQILDYKLGYINKQGHILVSTVYFFDDKVFYSSEALESFIKKRNLSVKNRVKKKIIKFINKL